MSLLHIWYFVIANLAAGCIIAFTLIPFGMVMGWFDYKDYPKIRKRFMYGVFTLWLVVMGICGSMDLYCKQPRDIFKIKGL